MTASPSPYRIAIDARFLRKDSAGIGKYSRELLSRLAQLDTVNHYTIYLTEKDLPDWTISQPNFVPKVVPTDNYSWQEQAAYLKELVAGRYDLVHFLNFNHPLFYMRPFVTTLHDLTVYLNPIGRSQSSIARRLAFIAIMRHAVMGAKKVIAISEHTAQDAQKHLGVSHAKMEVIYEGGPEPVELPFGNKAMVQDYLGSRQPYFLFVSQWRPHKGMITLVRAFEHFKRTTGLPHQLVLAGNQKDATPELREILAASAFAHDILAPGFIPDEIKPSVYRNATAYINPSEYEGFGLPILEAFAYGAPVIAANNSSLPEIVGKAGLLFATKDESALSTLMQQIVSDQNLARELVQKGAVQLKKFSWDSMAAKTLNVYMGILEKRR